MTDSALAKFEKRVIISLGWATLAGLAAGLTIVPEMQQGAVSTARQAEVPVVTEHAMVLPVAPPAPPQVRPVTKPTPKPQVDLAARPQKERVRLWFAEFDRIRREAQMSPAEKATAIRLWATSQVATSQQDTTDADALLSTLMNRYAKASRELDNLQRIPETRTLQQGLLAFFRRAHTDFRQYHNTLNNQSTRLALMQMQQGRKHLAVLDVRNKSLDRKLRRQYGIAELN